MSQVHIFVSYSHDDARWFADDKLMPRLIKSLEIIGAEVWYDHRRLGGGDPWKQEIVDAIKKAHIAVLPISRNFLNSDFIHEVELPRIERRFDQGELIVVPILVGHCNWQNVRMLSRPQMIPGKPTPLIGYLDSPAEWDRVQEEIFSSIERQVDRVREKYHLQAPTRHESVIDPSTTITRLSSADLPYVPVLSQPQDPKPERRDDRHQDTHSHDAPRRDAAAYDTQGHSARSAVPKKLSPLKSVALPVAAAVLATLITAGILLRGSNDGESAHPSEAVQASDKSSPARESMQPPDSQSLPPATTQPVTVPASVPPAVQPAAQTVPQPQPASVQTLPEMQPTQPADGNLPIGPGTQMPASTPGPTTPQPVTIAPSPELPAAPEPTPQTEQPKPSTASAPKAVPVKKPVVAPLPKPAPKKVTPAPQPQKSSNPIEDAAVELLKKQIDKIKR